MRWVTNSFITQGWFCADIIGSPGIEWYSEVRCHGSRGVESLHEGLHDTESAARRAVFEFTQSLTIELETAGDQGIWGKDRLVGADTLRVYVIQEKNKCVWAIGPTPQNSIATGQAGSSELAKEETIKYVRRLVAQLRIILHN